MKLMTLEAYRQAFRDQGMPSKEQWAVVCPCCGTVQTAQDLIAAGAGKTFYEVEGYLGFSCIGRFTGKGSPRKVPDGEACNWTLGGLFRLHELEVVTSDGERHPRFEPATPEQAKAHAEKGATS